MSVFERYQLFNTAEQHLFDPACPVYVHRTQLTQDLQSGAVLLQVRMVNMGDRALRGVYLRVTCLDEKDQVLTVLHYVPLTDLEAPKGGVFGDDRVLPIQERGTRAVRVYVQRVTFDDGSVWNEAEHPEIIRLPAPVVVLPTDKDYGYLSQMSRSGGVKNDVRYQTLSCGWYCTCGLPNGSWRKRCGYCGADREWLFTHMKAPEEAPAEKAPPAPEPPATASVPVILSDPEPTPVFFSPVLREPEPEPEPVYGPAEEEFPVIAPTQPPKKKSRPGLIVAIVLLALGILGALGYCGWRFGMPLYRYWQGENLIQENRYEEAREIFTGLGDFKDSPERVKETWYHQAVQMMQEDRYSEAYRILTDISGYKNADELAANCLLGQGIAAYNRDPKDLDAAWDFVNQLRQSYPDFAAEDSKVKDLACATAYSFGDRAMKEEDYRSAGEWFLLAEGYSNSAELLQRCAYELALEQMEAEDYQGAIAAFEELDGYGDSQELILECKYLYLISDETDTHSQLARDYMQTLLEEDYQDAAYLYQWRVRVYVNQDDSFSTAAVRMTNDLTKLRIHCSIDGGLTRDPVTVVLIYTLPDKRSGTVEVITGENGDTGSLSWTTLGIPSCDTSGTATLKFLDAEGGEIDSIQVELQLPQPEAQGN